MLKLKAFVFVICFCLSMPALAKSRAKVKQTKIDQRVPVTVSFAADEGWEEAEKARAEFLRKSRERRQAQAQAEAAKRPKKVAVKVGEKQYRQSVDDALEAKALKKEVGLTWRQQEELDLKEASVDDEVSALNSKDFEITPEERAELNELLKRQPSSTQMQAKDVVAPTSMFRVSAN